MHLERWLLAAITVGVLLAGASAVGGAAPPAPAAADDDAPLTGEARDRAASAAVTHVGGGEVTDTESGDDGAAYGVEVRKPDGTQVEVNLDETYAVTQAEPDDDGPGDDDDDADDVNDTDGPDDPDDDPGEPASGPDDD